MVSFAFIVGSLTLATLVPAYAALVLVPKLKLRARYLAAFGLGVFVLSARRFQKKLG